MIHMDGFNGIVDFIMVDVLIMEKMNVKYLDGQVLLAKEEDLDVGL